MEQIEKLTTTLLKASQDNPSLERDETDTQALCDSILTEAVQNQKDQVPPSIFIREEADLSIPGYLYSIQVRQENMRPGKSVWVVDICVAF